MLMPARQKVPENGCIGDEHLKVQRIESATNQDKLDILVNSIDTSAYSYISECVEFEDAMTKLNSAYVKPINEIFARYRLSSYQEEAGESLEHFLQLL